MLSLLVGAYVVKKHIYKAKIDRLRKVIPLERQLLLNKSQILPFLFEFLLGLTHFFPMLDQSEYIVEHINMVYTGFTFVHLLKLFILVELMSNYSPLNSSKGRFVGSLSKIKFDMPFLTKSWIKSHPLAFLSFSMPLFLFVNAYLLYVSERETAYVSCYEYDWRNREVNYKNMLWLTTVGFLTVGYGDYYPTTALGRLVNTFTAFGGLVYSATIIGMVHE